MAQTVYLGSDRDLPLILKKNGDFFDLTGYVPATDSIVAKMCTEDGAEQLYTLDVATSEIVITKAAQGTINIPMTQAKTALLKLGDNAVQVDVTLANKKTTFYLEAVMTVSAGLVC